MPLKDELSNALAAALPCAGWTALMSLDKLPNLCGRRVLVSGGGYGGYFRQDRAKSHQAF